MERNTNIWDFLAYKIAKRISKDSKVPLTIELIRSVLDEIRLFNESNVVQIFFKLIDKAETDRIEKEISKLACK